MRTVNLAVWHCSATKRSQTYTLADIRKGHVKRGFRKEGYHIYIRQDGSIEYGRAVWEIGAHARGFNRNSIGVCYEGGIGEDGRPVDTRTPEQKRTMKLVRGMLDFEHPGIMHVGHRDLSVDLNGDGVISKSEWMKVCPCYGVKNET